MQKLRFTHYSRHGNDVSVNECTGLGVSPLPSLCPSLQQCETPTTPPETNYNHTHGKVEIVESNNPLPVAAPSSPTAALAIGNTVQGAQGPRLDHHLGEVTGLLSSRIHVPENNRDVFTRRPSQGKGKKGGGGGLLSLSTSRIKASQNGGWQLCPGTRGGGRGGRRHLSCRDHEPRIARRTDGRTDGGSLSR